MKTLQSTLPILKTTVAAPKRSLAGRLGTKARDAQRLRVWRSNPRCYMCGVILPYEAFELDHVIAVADGGALDDSNVAVACVECHRAKTNVEISNRGR